VNHSYTATGNYSVRLTVTAADGSTGLFDWAVTVS